MVIIITPAPTCKENVNDNDKCLKENFHYGWFKFWGNLKITIPDYLTNKPHNPIHWFCPHRTLLQQYRNPEAIDTFIQTVFPCLELNNLRNSELF